MRSKAVALPFWVVRKPSVACPALTRIVGTWLVSHTFVHRSGVSLPLCCGRKFQSWRTEEAPGAVSIARGLMGCHLSTLASLPALARGAGPPWESAALSELLLSKA